MSAPAAPRLPSEDESRDLGFGSVVARESRQRLLNHDGSFNVTRRGLGVMASLNVYHALLTMSWSRFLCLVTAAYLIANALFGVAYFVCGAGALQSPDAGLFGGEFMRAFFFSVETFATIGYGQISPVGVSTNLLMTAESLVGIVSQALVTGLVFARFARPTAQIVFSRRGLIAPYRGGTAFMFRITNRRSTQLIDLGAKVSFTYLEKQDGTTGRQFADLALERTRVAFFPLAWTIVHAIDEASPLHGMTPERLHELDGEFLILLTGTDETFSQTVHARSSYKPHEVVWNAKFGDLFNRHDDVGLLSIDVSRLDDVEPV